MTRRRKFWGWGFEDQQPPHEQVEAAAAGAREHLGFGPAEVERPARLEDIELPPPRLEPPASLAAICRTDPYERAAHAYGKSYRDVVRAFRGQLRQPARRGGASRATRPSSSACSPGARRRAPRRSRSAAARAWSAGWSRRADRPARDASTSRRSTACSRWTRRRARRGSRRGPPGRGLEEQLREHGLTLRHFPQSFEYSTLGGWIATRAGGHYATLHTHIDDFVESVRALTPRGWWESRRLPGSGAGPSPDRMLIGSEGILGVITEAWMRVQDAPRFRESAAVLFDSFESGAQAVRALSQSGLHPSNCRLLDPGEAALTGAAPRRARPCSCWASSRPTTSSALDGPRPRAVRRPRRPAARAARASREGAWRDAFLQAPYLRDTLVAAASSPRPSRRRSPGTASPTLVDGVREGVARGARRRGRRHLPAHARVPGRRRALLHGARPRPARRRARAVGGAEAGGLRGDRRGGRHDHAPPRGRPRPQALVRPPAPRAVRRGSARREVRRGPGRDPESRAC